MTTKVQTQLDSISLMLDNLVVYLIKHMTIQHDITSIPTMTSPNVAVLHVHDPQANTK